MNYFLKTASLAQKMIIATALITMMAMSPSSAATKGVWEYDGFSTAEESEGNAGHSATVTMRHNGEEVFLTLSCSVPGKSISMSMGGREKFEKSSYAAVKAARGKIAPDESYLDLYIDDQIFGMKSMVFDINGELGFIDDFPLNGPVMTAFLRGSSAVLNVPGLQVTIPLKNSANAICTTLKQCNVVQSYCQSTGR